MRKTTIFRSKVWVFAGLLVGVQPLQAQDPMQTPLPEVHVVSQGETLWGIAERYFGDPFLWPEIYRLNTLVVEDPHWIFPGEELRFSGMPDLSPIQPPVDPVIPDSQAMQQPPPPPVDTAAVAPPPMMPPAPPTAMVPTVFSRQGPIEVGGPVTVGAARMYRPVRRGEFYAAGFLTENELLPYGRVVRTVGQVEMSRLPDAGVTLLYGEIEVAPPADASYRVNDTLLIVREGNRVRDWGQVVIPTGVAHVTSVTEDGYYAEVIAQFDRVQQGQRLLPLEPFVDPGSVVPVPATMMMEGTVIQARDRSPLPGQQDVVFIDLGRADGVSLGDMFVILKKPAPEMAATDTVAYLQIVHRRENSSSGILGFIRSMGVEPGAVARLFRKMP